MKKEPRIISGGGAHFIRIWNNRFIPSVNITGTVSRQIRARLGLPPNGKGC
jgi:hypothetical protein